MVEAPETIEWLYNQNKTVLVDRIGRLERQIAELRDHCNAMEVEHRQAIEEMQSALADKARLSEALRSIAEGNLGDATWQANYDRIREVARAALSGSGAGGWREIETAPKDGTNVLLHGRVYPPSIDAGKVSTVIGYWTDVNGGGWVWYGALSTIWTHWQPLPSPPEGM